MFETISDARVHVQVYTMGLRIFKQLNFIDTYKGKNYTSNGRLRVNFAGDMFDISSHWCSGPRYLVTEAGTALYPGYVLHVYLYKAALTYTKQLAPTWRTR